MGKQNWIQRTEHERAVVNAKGKGLMAGFLYASVAMLIIFSSFILLGWV